MLAPLEPPTYKGLRVLILMLGCYLLSDGVIDCAADEPCAQDSGVEGDTDADTDTDTDTDTDPQDLRTTGVVTSALLTDDWSFVVTAPDKSEVLRHEQAGSVAGPVLWLDDYSTGVLVDESLSWVVTPNATYPSMQFSDPVTDLEWLPPYFIVLFETGLLSADSDNNLELTWLEINAFSQATRVAADGLGGLWILDLGSGTPSLYSWNGTLEPLYKDYDEHAGRSVGLFRGPEDRPWVCSAGGGVWPVSALAKGATKPVRLADNQLSSVIDCDYDPGSDEFILFSRDGSVVRLGPNNRTELWLEVPGLVRGGIYDPAP